MCKTNIAGNLRRTRTLTEKTTNLHGLTPMAGEEKVIPRKPSTNVEKATTVQNVPDHGSEGLASDMFLKFAAPGDSTA